jgi:hypothetical protein
MVTLDEETNQYLQDYMEEHKLRFPGEAIMDICQKYRSEEKKEWSLETISEVVSHNLHDVLREELKKIRLDVNQTGKHAQVLLELMNGLYFHEGYKGIITTGTMELDEIKYAREEVEKRIQKQRQKRLD